MQYSSRWRIQWHLLALESTLLFVLFLLRTAVLRSEALPDYDSVKNWEIVRSMAQGDFQQLFHHASPTFYLLLLPFYKLAPSHHTLVWVSAICNVLAIWLLVRLVQNIWHIPQRYAHFLLVLVGTSPFLTVSATYVSIESVSLLLFAWAFRAFLRSRDGSFSSWLNSWVYFTLAFTVNYKTALFFPIFYFIAWKANYFFKRKSAYLIPFLIPIIAIFIYCFIGYVLTDSFELYPKYLISNLFLRNPHPTIQLPLLNTDVFFYLQYIYDFESPLFLIVFIALLGKFWWLNRKPKQQPKNIFTITKNQGIVFTFLAIYLTIMTFLPKAPRGLLFAYPLLFSLGYFYMLGLIKTPLFRFIFLAGCLLWNTWQLQRWVYPYIPTKYPMVAEYIISQDIKKLHISVGRGILPFLPDSVTHTIHFSTDDLPTKPFYLLRDGYHRVVKVGDFDTVSGNLLQTWKEPTLCSPFLFLESCEYNGTSYNEALQNWRAMQRKEKQLELLHIP